MYEKNNLQLYDIFLNKIVVNIVYISKILVLKKYLRFINHSHLYNDPLMISLTSYMNNNEILNTFECFIIILLHYYIFKIILLLMIMIYAFFLKKITFDS